MNLSRKDLSSLRCLVMHCMKGVEKQFRTPVPYHVSSYCKVRNSVTKPSFPHAVINGEKFVLIQINVSFK